jgi:hypothetical protein
MMRRVWPRAFVLDDRARIYTRVFRESAGRELCAEVLDVHGTVFVFTYVDAFATGLVCCRRVVDDVEHALVVQGEIVGESPLFLPGEYAAQVILREQLAMRIVVVSWRASETAIVVLTELVQVDVASLAVADTSEAKLFDKTILECLMSALDASFPCRRRYRSVEVK